jgi:hypothetical protein
MKSGIRTFVRPALAGAFRRLTIESNRIQLRFRHKTPHLLLLLALKLAWSLYTAQAL